jgi:hypothetical protein
VQGVKQSVQMWGTSMSSNLCIGTTRRTDYVDGVNVRVIVV